MSARILVIDDDFDWRTLLGGTLKQEGFEVSEAAMGSQALTLIQAAHFDLVILDVQLPDGEGYEVCLEIRKRDCYIPIIMISGFKKEAVDRELGLRMGADHYFQKPVSTREITAQVRALLRMASAMKKNASDDWLEVDPYLRLHIKHRQVTAAGKVIDLAPQEFDLLVYLVQHAGEPCARDDLIESVWGGASAQGVSDEALNTTIARLRAKIEPDPGTPRYILTVQRRGYRFRDL